MKYGSQIEGLLGRMRQAGITDAARRFIPEWWEPDTEQHPDAMVEVKLRMARAFGLNLDALLDRNAIEFDLPGKVRFKRAKSQKEAQKLNPFVAYAASLARTIAELMEGAPLAIPAPKPLAIRKVIFDALPGLRWLSLEALLDYCWHSGIAVLHIDNPPFQAKGFDGLTLVTNGRPVIVLARAERYPAWQVFILAHELAHILLGHVGEDEVIVDEALFDGARKPSQDEPEEAAADALALKLLGGATSAEIIDPRQYRRLADYIDANVERGIATKTDPGHLVLRAGFELDQWKKARTALAILQEQRDIAEGGLYDARAEIARQLLGHLDLEDLADDARTVLLDAITPRAAATPSA